MPSVFTHRIRLLNDMTRASRCSSRFRKQGWVSRSYRACGGWTTEKPSRGAGRQAPESAPWSANGLALPNSACSPGTSLPCRCPPASETAPDREPRDQIPTPGQPLAIDQSLLRSAPCHRLIKKRDRVICNSIDGPRGHDAK